MLAVDSEVGVKAFVANMTNNLPGEFDFFSKYPGCLPPTTWNQGQCGSCWAWSLAGANTLRTCKAATDKGWKVPVGFALSVQDLVSCVGTDVSRSGNGCTSGKTNAAAAYFARRATLDWACLPYKGLTGDDRRDLCPKGSEPPASLRPSVVVIPEAGSRTKNSFSLGTTLNTQLCGAKFGPHGDDKDVVKYLHLLSPANRVRELAIMNEIMQGGPVAATYRVPVSFLGYRGQGVYKKEPVDPAAAGQDEPTHQHAIHAITIVGWGTDPVGGPYWLCVNQWGSVYPSTPKSKTSPEFYKGMFRIARGNNECNIESISVTATTIKLPLIEPAWGGPLAVFNNLDIDDASSSYGVLADPRNKAPSSLRSLPRDDDADAAAEAAPGQISRSDLTRDGRRAVREEVRKARERQRAARRDATRTGKAVPEMLARRDLRAIAAHKIAVSALCQSDFSQGSCVPEGSCPTVIIVKATKRCPLKNQSCCQVASSVPRSPCEDAKGECTTFTECAVKPGHKAIQVGYCAARGPADRTTTCCLNKGVDPSKAEKEIPIPFSFAGLDSKKVRTVVKDLASAAIPKKK
jgi:hypothetical protein